MKILLRSGSLFLFIICSVSFGNCQYYGSSMGSFTRTTHLVSGTAYIVDNNRIQIRGFNYDGAAPDAFFYVRRSSTPLSEQGRDDQLIDLHGRNPPVRLDRFVNSVVVLTLPYSTSEIAWISVWCRQFSANFGEIVVSSQSPAPFVPAPFNAGRFTTRAHLVRSGDVIVLNSRTVRINNFNYDGFGPDAFFWVGPGTIPNSQGRKIPDENGNINRKLGPYNDRTITLTLPMDIEDMNIGYLSCYCVSYNHNFGEVLLDQARTSMVPPFIVGSGTGPPPPTTAPTTTLAPSTITAAHGCRLLSNRLNVGWNVTSTTIIYQVEVILENDEYVAFGVSGSDSASSMFNADVAVMYIKNAVPKAVDYNLNSYAQCSSGRGACPDTMVTGGVDDVTLISHTVLNKKSTFVVSRPLSANSGSSDRAIDPTGNTFIVWALGALTPEELVVKHLPLNRLNGNLGVVFGTPSQSTCMPLSYVNTEAKPAWETQKIVANENATFTVQIGPSGGERGYAGITGKPAWGISWYVNGLLIPELYLLEGRTYTFLVSGGNDPSMDAKYHPLYITNSEGGGYAKASQQARQGHKIYAGVTVNSTTVSNPAITLASTLSPTFEFSFLNLSSLNPTVGPFCEYVTTAASNNDHQTFGSFANTLRSDCMSSQGRSPGVFTFTVTPQMPDQLFYQCYTHTFLGWKIFKRSANNPWPITANAVTPSTTTFRFVTSLTTLFMVYASIRV